MSSGARSACETNAPALNGTSGASPAKGRPCCQVAGDAPGQWPRRRERPPRASQMRVARTLVGDRANAVALALDVLRHLDGLAEEHDATGKLETGPLRRSQTMACGSGCLMRCC